MKPGFTFLGLVLGITLVVAQTFSKQGISFSLFDKNGTRLTEEAISNGTIKVYSLREQNGAKDQMLTYNKERQLFSLAETVVSPGISLALVSPTDTMYIAVFGRSGTDRVIEGITVQRGSYVLTSNEFGNNKQFNVTDWSPYLEDEEPASTQDLSAYAFQLKSKNPITLVQAVNN